MDVIGSQAHGTWPSSGGSGTCHVGGSAAAAGRVRMEHLIGLLLVTCCFIFVGSSLNTQSYLLSPSSGTHSGSSSLNPTLQKSESGSASSEELRQFYKQYPHLKASEVYAIVSYHSLAQRLPAFLKHFDRLLEGDSRLHLVISALYSDSGDVTNQVNDIMSKQTQQRVSQLFYEEAKFSRGRLINHGAAFVRQRLNDQATLFVTDVDVINSIGFVSRCRKLAKIGSRVYYPIVWSQHKPRSNQEVIGELTPEKEFTSIHLSNNFRGLWREFGFGMLCINVKDFLRVKGFPEYEAWGSEDVQLNTKLRKKGLRIERNKDPGIIHLWHPQNCTQKAGQSSDPKQGDVLQDCLRSTKKIDLEVT